MFQICRTVITLYATTYIVRYTNTHRSYDSLFDLISLSLGCQGLLKHLISYSAVLAVRDFV